MITREKLDAITRELYPEWPPADAEKPAWTIETLRTALREADAEWGRYCVTCDGRHDDERHARLRGCGCGRGGNCVCDPNNDG